MLFVDIDIFRVKPSLNIFSCTIHVLYHEISSNIENIHLCIHHQQNFVIFNMKHTFKCCSFDSKQKWCTVLYIKVSFCLEYLISHVKHKPSLYKFIQMNFTTKTIWILFVNAVPITPCSKFVHFRCLFKIENSSLQENMSMHPWPSISINYAKTHIIIMLNEWTKIFTW